MGSDIYKDVDQYDRCILCFPTRLMVVVCSMVVPAATMMSMMRIAATRMTMMARLIADEYDAYAE